VASARSQLRQIAERRRKPTLSDDALHCDVWRWLDLDAFGEAFAKHSVVLDVDGVR